MMIMKISSADIPKMALAAIGTAIVFLVILNLPQSAAPPTKRAERISWDEALKLKQEYLDHKPLMVDYDDTSGKPTRGPLQGFRMDAKAIDEVINYNQNSPSKSGKADQIIFYFGIDGYSEAAGDKIPIYNIVVAGIENGKIMKNPASSDIDHSSVMDRADPCPPNCPK